MSITSNSERRYGRGESHPDNGALVFFRYHRGKEIWVTHEMFLRKLTLARAVAAKRRKTPKYKAKMRDYFRDYNHRPEQKVKRAKYYSRPDVLERCRVREFNSPERMAKREARTKWRAERAAYRQSEEYKEKLRAEARDYYIKNKSAVIKKAGARRRKSPSIRLKQNISRRIRYALNSRCSRKSSSTLVLLGCTIREFKVYLETHWKPGMTWDNYGLEWELDHRVPLASFVLADPHQQRIAFNFLNHQPLWKPDNRKKSDRMADGTLGRKIIRFARFTG